MERVGEGGAIIPSCTKLSLKSLTLGKRQISLKSNAVTSDCLIETKDHGNLRLKINMASFSYSVLVTPAQEEAFKKLELTAQPSK